MDLNQKIEYLNSIMEEAVKGVFETKESKRPGKRIIPPNVRKLNTRKLKLSKSLKKTGCPVRISALRKEYMEVEDTLKISYERFRYKKELEVISNLKENPSVFYKFARKKAVVQSNVGPLRNKKGEMILDKLEMAEVLGEQYFSIGQEPYVDLEDPTFKDSLTNLDLGLREFTIDPVKVREILLKLPTKSGPGPDGIPPTV